jgi:N-acetylneuraminic acid mutarotase
MTQVRRVAICILLIAAVFMFSNAVFASDTGNTIPTRFIENGLPQGSAWNATYNNILGTPTPEISWASATPYPSQIDDHACSAYNDYIYCVGGLGSNTLLFPANSTYFAPVTQNGIGEWMQASSYPLLVLDHSCSSYNGYLYCVGGEYGEVYNSVYFTPISSSGTGNWTATTPYPTTVYNHVCVANNGYLYCIGGTLDNFDTNDTNLAYYAPVSSAGVGAWLPTNSYPLKVDDSSCSVYSSSIYCVGGREVDEGKSYPAVYYANLSSSGISAWLAANSYPIPVYDQACASAAGYLYCFGGYNGLMAPASPTNSVFYAQITPRGLGAWQAAEDYPLALRSQSAVAYGDMLYVIGGYNDRASNGTSAVYYTNVSTNSVLFSAPQGTYSYSVPNQIIGKVLYVPDHANGKLASGGTLLVEFTPSASGSQQSPTLAIVVGVVFAIAAILVGYRARSLADKLTLKKK